MQETMLKVSIQRSAAHWAHLPANRAVTLHIGNTLGQQVKSWLQHSHEVGGVLAPDHTGRVLQAVDVHAGSKDAVAFSKGAIQFHTHPGVCRKPSDCYVDAPSPADVAGALKSAARYGTVAHLVFTHNGTYAMQLPQRGQPVLHHLQKLFDGYTGDDPSAFRQQWLRTMRKAGVPSIYVPRGQVLQVTVTTHS